MVYTHTQTCEIKRDGRLNKNKEHMKSLILKQNGLTSNFRRITQELSLNKRTLITLHSFFIPQNSFNSFSKFLIVVTFFLFSSRHTFTFT